MALPNSDTIIAPMWVNGDCPDQFARRRLCGLASIHWRTHTSSAVGGSSCGTHQLKGVTIRLLGCDNRQKVFVCCAKMTDIHNTSQGFGGELQ
eukprot:680566-Amphidinium_carterae.2